MIKEVLITLIQRQLSPSKTGDSLNRYHPALINTEIETIYNEIMFGIAQRNEDFKGFGDLGIYAKKFGPVPVLKDSVINEYYAISPVQLMKLPDDAEFIGVSTAQDINNRFKRWRQGAGAIFTQTHVGLVDPRPRYYPEGQQVRFPEEYWNPNITEVILWLVAPYNSYGMKEQIPIPGSKENNLVSLVVDRLMGRKPEDKTLDNNAQ